MVLFMSNQVREGFKNYGPLKNCYNVTEGQQRQVFFWCERLPFAKLTWPDDLLD
jgi:hypothetical protein